MATKRIEVIAPHIKYTGDEEIAFGSILKNANKKKRADAFKDYQLTLLSTELPNCIIGIINTGQNKNLPPKKEKATGRLSKLGINIEKENLCFGNILLYDAELNVLLYEVNMNGCFINNLRDYLTSKWNDIHDEKIEISFDTVSRKGEYSRMLKMTYYKEYYAEFANPTEILQAYKDDNSTQFSLAKRYLSDGVKNNSDKLIVKFSTYGRKNNKTGLSRQALMKFVNSVRYLFNGDQKKNVIALKVEGYFSDPALPRSLQPINLIADTFNIFIKLTDKVLQEDIQEIERKREIEKLYSKHLPELKYIFNRI